MSKSELDRLLHTLDSTTTNEIESTYGIVVEDDGTVWDSLEGGTFDSIYEWAIYATENEDITPTSKHCQKHWHDE